MIRFWILTLALSSVCLGFPAPSLFGGGNSLPNGPRVLFHSDFNEGEAGALPLMAGEGGPWRSLTGSSSGIQVVADQEGWFGSDTENRFLSVRNAGAFSLFADLAEPADVMTLSMDFIGRNSSNDFRWLNVNLLTAATGPANRAHVTSFNLIAAQIRGANVSYGGNNVRLRIDTVLNNSSEVISYSHPDGTEVALGPARAAVWVDGKLVATDYVFGREDSSNPWVRTLWIQADGDAVVSFDLNEVFIVEGAHVLSEPGEIPSPPEPPMVYIGDDGRLEYTTDGKGNRIPDFSNAGYMGGGVPIPDVPVRRVLHPSASGDDTARIQAAINEVGAMPFDEHGFRGALLLTAGEYRVNGSLFITQSGVVLRGEGRGEDGTVLRATGTQQRTLILVGSTASWSEVPGTRRDLIDGYVPVGARSFQVNDASAFDPGDTVIVHRPSTAEWISAIGMDQIPPRSDGLPVSQWAPGGHDQHYDRIVTAVDGNRVTIDAPLVNAFEHAFGGGWIYRYSWPQRISHVGIESLRSVSDYDPSKRDGQGRYIDEDHAWTFIEFRAVQNGWVRETTAVHYGFGNTFLLPGAKWITVRDSANLDPVSTVAGSRRYPFYVQGQLNLVKNCFARFARHDFAIHARTRGPNVFLYCNAENSFSDTGPHHRWSTGTLYDNVQVPANTIAIQNRLNFGSGHGWAGANDVVWNSSAQRVVVQNPPTAQNWAIGVVGAKWQGAFPDYADDGYWISHWTPVEPQSLYEKQLEDRLSEEGPGGLISLVRVLPAPTSLSPGETVEIRLIRRGVLDGGVTVVADIDGADLLEPGSRDGEFFLPARTGTAQTFSLTLRDDAFLYENGEVLIRFRHGPGYSVYGIEESDRQVRLSVPARPWEAWQADHFSAEERDDPEISGEHASPARDGIANLVKFAVGLDPLVPAVTRDFLTTGREEGKLRFTFLRRSGGIVATDVETSEDLRDWQPAGSAVEIDVEPVDTQWEKITVTETSPGSAKGRFFRLNVSRN